jgi:hypothetical protein
MALQPESPVKAVGCAGNFEADGVPPAGSTGGRSEAGDALLGRLVEVAHLALVDLRDVASGLAGLRALHVAGEGGDRDRREDAEDHDDDHQLDQGEASENLLHGTLH